MKSKENNRLVGGKNTIFSRAWRFAAAGLLLVAGLAVDAGAAPANIAATRHNLSKDGTGTVKANDTTATQVCVFCHTPHAATTGAPAPLWNRNINKADGFYTRYTSSSLDATAITDGFNAQPAGSSLLCLSCHDGTIALGNVNVLNRGPASIPMTGAESDYTMPKGFYGETSGYTRRLGKDLSNDHPISITYDDTLAGQDGEMARLTTVNPKQNDITSGGAIIGLRRKGVTPPLFPLAPTGKDGAGQVQCATCHDPHVTAEKFLRASRFQIGTPTSNAFSKDNDIMCLACHTKLGATWAESSHAKPSVADEQYLSEAATIRGFPAGTAVWQAACLNCHDTHTVSGSRRLLREGVGSTSAAYTSYQAGSAVTNPADNNKVSAIENTCYQCHSPTANRVIGTKSGSTVPDIWTEFERAVRMPIRSADQAGSTKKETHDIVNADFIESDVNLGRGVTANRHVECTDCHNPHRVRRSSTFYGTSDTAVEGAKRTHNVGGVEGNVISGALRGTWGVEPSFGTITTWPQNPSSYTVKKGDPTGNSTARGETWVTREYQLCFKCHSSYSNSDTATSYPSLGNNLKGTPKTTNGMDYYTNVAGEFGAVRATDPPSSGLDQGETDNAGTAPAPDYAPTPVGQATSGGPGATNNHRSWHPVMWPTGRTRAERGSDSWNNLRYPYALADTGKMTMHCSDCHGQFDSWTQGASLAATSGGPDLTKTQGPHGSDKNFLLKGIWTDAVTPNAAAGANSTGTICGRCHDPKNATSGFSGTSNASHGWSPKAGRYCMFCHVAVPHGWKNKAFLVNLNCIQEEGGTGYTTTCKAYNNDTNGTAEVTLGPYYNRAKLRIGSWAKSGNWGEGNCISKEWMSSACGY